MFAELNLRPASATAIGSFPGSDSFETARIIRGELPDFPLLQELPGRGPGADMIGRCLGALSRVAPDFSGQTTTDGWRLSGQTGGEPPRAMRRSASWLDEDLDAAGEEFSSYTGPYKVALCGPFTLAASVELPGGERMLSDAGATRDAALALNEAIRMHVADIRRRLPQARLVFQLDEPALPGVLTGKIPTQSGWSRHSPIETQVAEEVLGSAFAAITAAGAVPAIHCCGRKPPLELFRRAGAKLISIDLTLGNTANAADDEELGQLLDAGLILMAGIAPSTPSQVDKPLTTGDVLKPLLTVLSRLSISYESAGPQLALTPTCGLAGAGSPAHVRKVLASLTAAGRALRDETEPDSEAHDHERNLGTS